MREREEEESVKRERMIGAKALSSLQNSDEDR